MLPTDDREGELPEFGANAFSRALYLWLDEFLLLAWRSRIKEHHLYRLPDLYTSGYYATRLGNALLDLPTKGLKRPRRLIKGVYRCFGIPTFFPGVLEAALSLLAPYVFAKILVAISVPSRPITSLMSLELVQSGYALCTMLFALQVFRSILINGAIIKMSKHAMAVRTALMSLVYQKALRLSSSSMQQASTGRIMNIMSSDVFRVEGAIEFMQFIWLGPLQVFAVIAVLFRLLGWPALVGLSVMLGFIPIQTGLVYMLSSQRKYVDKYTDTRVRMFREILSGIRVLKMLALEAPFVGRLAAARKKELRGTLRIHCISAASSMLTATVPILSSVAALICYALAGGQFVPEIIFPTLAYFNILEAPLFIVPFVSGLMVSGYASLKRIEEFLDAPEVETPFSIDRGSGHGLVLAQVDFGRSNYSDELEEDATTATATSAVADISAEPAWECKTPIQGPPLHLDCEVPRGSLVAIVGPVGSGKSSLLSALLGEARLLHGSISFGGTVAICTQQAFILAGTVRDNILFGSSYESKRYCATIQACALQEDIAHLPAGDATQIGEKGSNLSGGQKQRICLARLLYSQAEVMLLDDPLSAVDAKTSRFIFDNCIRKAMQGRTRILVTHHLHILPAVDRIIVMQNGLIIAQGTFRDLKDRPDLVDMFRHFADEEKEEEGADKAVPWETRNPEPVAVAVQKDDNPAAASAASFITYFKASGKSWIPLVLVLCLMLNESLSVGRGLWLSNWSSGISKLDIPKEYYLYIYAGFGIAQSVVSWLCALLFVLIGYLASLQIHNTALNRVIRSPIAFFDDTPHGLIVSRFSRDMAIIDNQINEHVYWATIAGFMICSTILLVIFIAWPLIIILSIPCILQHFLQAVFRAAYIQLLQLGADASAEVSAHFSESLSGLLTLRVYNMQASFLSKHHRLSDAYNRSAFITMGVRRWICLRSDVVGDLLTFLVAMTCIFMKVPSALAGLAIGYTMNISGVIEWGVKHYAEAERSLYSVTRMAEYASQLVPEGRNQRSIDKPPMDWPIHGAIQLIDLVVRHRPDIEPVIRGISASISAGERIAIVGRTGAGKSSVISAIFRLLEADSGQILIDGVDISTIELHELRARLSIVPQDPVLFVGTLRLNLDPEGKYCDKDLWQALEQVSLKKAIMRLHDGLDCEISENGENFSVGQRQLICLARAILRRTKIIVMDEATASIDLATDAVIQRSLRTCFSDHTLLTIAHRLDTVMDYDRIMVLDRGLLVEFDAPASLLALPNSQLSALVAETGSSNAGSLRMMAGRNK